MADLELRISRGKGRGVFALRPFEQREIIEVAPIILVYNYHLLNKYKNGRKTPFYHYCFKFDDMYSCIVGGFGSFYNESRENGNADFSLNKRKKIVTFRCIEPIQIDDEVFIDYGDENEYDFRIAKKKK